MADAAGNAAFGHAVSESGVGKAADKVSDRLKRAVLTTGGVAAKLAKAGPSIVLGTLVNLGWALISSVFGDDGDSEKDKAAHDAVGAAMAASMAARDGFLAQANAHAQAAIAGLAPLHEAATTSWDTATLHTLIEGAGTQVQAFGALELPEADVVGRALLARWYLQHAKSDDASNDQTNPVSWKAARTTLKRSENGTDAALPLDDDDNLQKKDLFAEQLRLAWARRGIALEQPIARIEKAWAAYARLEPKAAAGALGGLTVDVSAIQAPSVFAATLVAADREHAVPLGVPSYPCAKEDIEGAVAQQGFSMSCRIQLGVSGRCVVVERLHFVLTPKPAHDAYTLGDKCYDRPMPAAIRARQWSEAP